MSKPLRMFEIIQLLRKAKQPMRAVDIADTLGVSQRTAYRDILALQSMSVPIDGAAGVGYILRPGFDLPPITFTPEEIEAIIVGLALLPRTGDVGLQRAAQGVVGKISDIVPKATASRFNTASLEASGWHAVPKAKVDIALIRKAVRNEQRLDIQYTNGEGQTSERTILPLAVLYYVEAIVIAAWCERRGDFRHFRIDRIDHCTLSDSNFSDIAEKLRADWQEQHGLT
ncbi:MAG: YafY family protein [Halopseudomonas aestusnigri]